MRTIAIGIALFALAAGPAFPTGSVAHASRVTCQGLGKDVHWSDRRDPAGARLAITTEDGDMTLLLTDREVVLQLSDRTFSRVHRKLRDAEDEQDNWLASTIVSTVTEVVLEVLDHSLSCHVRNLRDVSYDDGALVFTGRRGQAVFGDGEVCDSDLGRAFSERDARDFVREFRRLKAGR